MKPSPGVALHDVLFAMQPHILKRKNDYYLRYQIAVPKESDHIKPLKLVLCSTKKKDKGYYYFSIPVSHFERGDVVERKLEDDQLTEFAKQNSVYWLNPDGSEVHIDIKK